MIPTENKIRIDKTINLGHILTIGTFAMLMMTNWALMDKRVVILEEARIFQKDRDASQDIASREKFQEVKEAVVDLKESVEKVADKIGVR